MKLLTLLAKSFSWKPYAKAFAEAEDPAAEATAVTETVVVLVEVENADRDNPSTLRQALKHIKWLANKKRMRNVVLHSFAHLGGDSAAPDQAQRLLEEVARRLHNTGYQVWMTPFGYFCEWDISVYGDSLAKVWKEI
ncbi:MAG: hypothetical protein OXE53_05555 [Deltaproteobacteria bacterium]|nr:hypothetical protein [Deltaproteobacteria bacterium]